MVEKSNLKGESDGQQRPSKRSLVLKVTIVLLLVAAVAGAILFKGEHGKSAAAPSRQSASNAERTNSPMQKQQKHLPRLVDLGAGKCIPCKMMVPILDELKMEYKGKFDVVVIDVWKNRSAGRKYRIRVIPTQIFYDAAGKELYRHQGFFAKDDILKKWKELGIELD